MKWIKQHRVVSGVIAVLVVVACLLGGHYATRSSSLADQLESKQPAYWIVLAPDKGGVKRSYNAQALPLAVLETQNKRVKVYGLSQSSDRAEVTLKQLMRLSGKELSRSLDKGEWTSEVSTWRKISLKVIQGGNQKTAGESLTWPTSIQDGSSLTQFGGHIDFSQPLRQDGHAIKIAGVTANGFINRDGSAIVRATGSRLKLDNYQDARVSKGW